MKEVRGAKGDSIMTQVSKRGQAKGGEKKEKEGPHGPSVQGRFRERKFEE